MNIISTKGYIFAVSLTIVLFTIVVLLVTHIIKIQDERIEAIQDTTEMIVTLEQQQQALIINLYLTDEVILRYLGVERY